MICIPDCTHFVLEDLVDPWFIETYGSDALRFLDRDLVDDIERLATRNRPAQN